MFFLLTLNVRFNLNTFIILRLFVLFINYISIVSNIYLYEYILFDVHLLVVVVKLYVNVSAIQVHLSI
jgi:hypothetical protein